MQKEAGVACKRDWKACLSVHKSDGSHYRVKDGVGRVEWESKFSIDKMT